MRRNEELNNQAHESEEKFCKSGILYTAFIFLNTFIPTIINAASASLGKEFVTELKWNVGKEVSEKQAISSSAYGSLIVFSMMSFIFAILVWHHSRQRQHLPNQLLGYFNATMGVDALAGAFLVSFGFHWLSNKMQGHNNSLSHSAEIGAMTQLPALMLIILGYFAFSGGKMIKNCCDRFESKNEENSVITITANSVNPFEQKPQSPQTAVVTKAPNSPNLSDQHNEGSLFHRRNISINDELSSRSKQHERSKSSYT